MAKKVFRYRGKTMEELQAMDEKDFVQLLPTKQRRNSRRGYTDEEKIVIALIKSGKDNIRTHCRTIVILPYMVGKTILIYNGKTFQKTVIVEDMLGHSFGEFSLTRKRLQHSSPGVGATKSTGGPKK